MHLEKHSMALTELRISFKAHSDSAQAGHFLASREFASPCPVELSAARTNFQPVTVLGLQGTLKDFVPMGDISHTRKSLFYPYEKTDLPFSVSVEPQSKPGTKKVNPEPCFKK